MGCLVVAVVAVLISFPSVEAQDDDLATAEQLDGQVEHLYAAGKYDEAIPRARQALSIRKQHMGLDHPVTANSLNNLATLYDATGDNTRAERLYQSALGIREKVLGQF